MSKRRAIAKTRPTAGLLTVTTAVICLSAATAFGAEASAPTAEGRADAPAPAAPQPPAPAGRQVVNFNRDWKFARAEQPGAEMPSLDDSAWQAVRLPHDWAVAGPFDANASGSTGKLPWRGLGWYRKTFTLEGAQTGKQVYLDFDGVMAFPQVYINGQLEAVLRQGDVDPARDGGAGRQGPPDRRERRPVCGIRYPALPAVSVVRALSAFPLRRGASVVATGLHG